MLLGSRIRSRNRVHGSSTKASSKEKATTMKTTLAKYRAAPIATAAMTELAHGLAELFPGRVEGTGVAAAGWLSRFGLRLMGFAAMHLPMDKMAPPIMRLCQSARRIRNKSSQPA